MTMGLKMALVRDLMRVSVMQWTRELLLLVCILKSLFPLFFSPSSLWAMFWFSPGMFTFQRPKIYNFKS